jgi:hypothetical protein
MHADEQHDCSGGVWEWCSVEGDTDELFAEKAAPEGEAGAGGRDPDIRRALRGGSRREPVDPESGGERKVLPFNARRPDTGFRVATTRAAPSATVDPTGPAKTGRDGLAEQLGLSPAGSTVKAEPAWEGIPLVEIKPGR